MKFSDFSEADVLDEQYLQAQNAAATAKAQSLTSLVATADVRLGSWLPGLVPDWNFTVRVIARRDR